MEKIYLGKDLDGEKIYLTKHTWDCDWYWGFGYLGNNNYHYHFDGLLDGKHFKVNEVFSETKIDQNQWYKIMEYFAQVYNLKQAYETYYRGGAHITSVENGLKKDAEMAERIKNDMKTILNAVWDYIGEME